MKNLKKSLTLTCLFSIGFLLFQIAEGTAQVKEMSAQDLTKESSAVFYGKCSKIRSEWNQNKSIIYTYVTVVPEEYIKGNLGSEAVIAVPGGKVGDIVYEVSDMPVFTEGEEVMAFVRTNAAGKNLVTGGYQGKMKIERDKNTGKRTIYGFGLGSQTGEQTQVIGQDLKPGKEKLEDFIAKVKAYLKN
jgi:hypothetical protein